MRILLVFGLPALTVISGLALGQSSDFRFNQNNVPGWTLMTVDERNAHKEALEKLKTYEECKAYIAAFREKMEARAREQGKTLRGPRHFVCDQLRSSGAIK